MVRLSSKSRSKGKASKQVEGHMYAAINIHGRLYWFKYKPMWDHFRIHRIVNNTQDIISWSLRLLKQTVCDMHHSWCFPILPMQAAYDKNFCT